MDVKTLFLLFAISNVFIGLLLLAFNYRNKNQREITFIYLCGKFGVAVFWVAFAYRAQWNIYITYVLANTLALMGTFVEFYCFYYVGRKPDYKVLLRYTAVILLVASSLFFFIPATPAVKVIHMSVIFVVLYLTGGLVTLFNQRGFPILRVVWGMSFFMCLTFLAKFFVPARDSGLLSPNAILVLNYIISFLLGFCWTIVYLSFLNQIAQREILAQKQAIERDNVKLKELNATRDKLFSIIAHDLRGPMQAIAQLGQLLAGKMGPLSDSDREGAIQAINKSAASTGNLLDNLLQWSMSETGRLRMKRERVGLAQLVNDSQEVLTESIALKSLSFENQIPSEASATADPHMIGAVFRNLIANAIKFTPEGGRISVSCGAHDGYVRVEITDTGVGIPPHIQTQLLSSHFQYFAKGTNNEPGSGLGLKLCKEFVEQNGGTIGMRSQEGKGSTFFFTLPVQ